MHSLECVFILWNVNCEFINFHIFRLLLTFGLDALALSSPPINLACSYGLLHCSQLYKQFILLIFVYFRLYLTLFYSQGANIYFVHYGFYLISSPFYRSLSKSEDILLFSFTLLSTYLHPSTGFQHTIMLRFLSLLVIIPLLWAAPVGTRQEYVSSSERRTAHAVLYEEDGLWGSIIFHQWQDNTPVIISLLFHNIKVSLDFCFRPTVPSLHLALTNS